MAGAFSPNASSSEPVPRQRLPDAPDARASRSASKRPWVMALSAMVPWMLASTIATATMSSELAPRADQTELPELQSPPPPPPAAQPGHSEGDDVYFDPMELIAV